MNYQHIYSKICERGKSRIKQPNDGLEKHHIIPKSCGGSDSDNNITVLTPKEHYICHKLLVKIYQAEPLFRKKMIYALWWMSKTRCVSRGGGVKVTSRDYERARKLFIEQQQADLPERRERFKKRHANGDYNYDYQRVAATLKETLSSLSHDEMEQRMAPIRKCDHKARGKAISRGKASQLRLELPTGEHIDFWSYDQVHDITGYTYDQIKYRMKAHNGVLPNGNKVRYLSRYRGNDVRRKNSNSKRA